MKLTAEISLYPLKEEYIPIIRDFIDALNEHGDLDVVTNAMSTQISGDYDRVFAILRQELKTSYNTFGKQVLVCKMIPGDLPIK
jgi:uncharacterized protein YqgV (UPF0045/DUF77 family)